MPVRDKGGVSDRFQLKQINKRRKPGNKIRSRGGAVDSSVPSRNPDVSANKAKAAAINKDGGIASGANQNMSVPLGDRSQFNTLRNPDGGISSGQNQNFTPTPEGDSRENGGVQQFDGSSNVSGLSESEVAHQLQYEQEMLKAQTPGGWKNIDLNNIWSDLKNVNASQLPPPHETVAIGGTLGFLFKKKAASTAITQIGKVGRPRSLERLVRENAALVAREGGSALSSMRYASNTVTQKATTSFLSKIMKNVFKNRFLIPVAITTFIGALGTYPFAGFIKEEALQVTDFAFRTASMSDNFEGMEEAEDLRDEMTNYDLWEKVLFGIPGVNIGKEIVDYVEGSKLKGKINRKYMEDRKYQIENGLTDADMYEKGRLEKEASEKRITDYRTEQYLLGLLAKSAADRAGDKESSRLWAKHAAEQRRLEKKEREEIAAFWLNYHKELNKIKEDNRPSQLNFGLL